MFKNLSKSILLTIIFIAILTFAACSPMRRESDRVVLQPDLIVQPADLHTALDMSLAMGDGRRVNWESLGF